jgi:hypothetical protein
LLFPFSLIIFGGFGDARFVERQAGALGAPLLIVWLRL